MASSPLAAIRRPVVPGWGEGDPFSSTSPHFSAHHMGAGPLGSRPQLQRGYNSDYFNINDIRGPSPASLAADLSQNFSLDSDASPTFPTPRRVLFANIGNRRSKSVAIPFNLSPSPVYPAADMMDFSPLPPQHSFLSATPRTAIHTQTWPSSSPDDMMMVDSPVPPPRQPYLESLRQTVIDRRRPMPRRPSLSRVKAISASGMLSGIPPLRFGTSSKFCNKAATASLGECFEAASPPQERWADSPATAGHCRRPSNPFLRSRKQVRRSLSMFEHPADIMRPKGGCDGSQDVSSPPTLSVEEDHELILPHFLPDDPIDTIPRITTDTLIQVLDGKFNQPFDHKLLIDCRFEYEYDGGHIDGSINYNDKALLSQHLFQTPMPGRTLMVLHCEYSAHRAPLMARHIRSNDRSNNADQYPHLTYPELYILDGGYSGFFSIYRSRCYPQSYIEMSDARHQRTCERELGRLKARKGLDRAQTFAFGQRKESCAEYSPTAIGRPRSRLQSVNIIGDSPILGESSQTRRMASY